MEKNIYIIRHCEAEGQPAESPLTERGHKQAQQLMEFFSDIVIDQIVSSPFLRAVQSVEPLSHVKNVTIDIDDRLAERRLSIKNLPDWKEKLKATFHDMDLAYEGGESSNQAASRAVKVIDKIISSESENAILVTHGNLMSLLIRHFNNDFGFEQGINLSNPDVFLLKINNSAINLDRIWN